jgi:hypothetical protein
MPVERMPSAMAVMTRPVAAVASGRDQQLRFLVGDVLIDLVT